MWQGPTWSPRPPMALTTLWGALVCYLSAYACLDSNGTAKGAAPSAINPTTTPGPALFNGQFTWKSQAQLNLWSWAQPVRDQLHVPG